jgi:Zn-dependent M28 family amino/carboxypeptidase
MKTQIAFFLFLPVLSCLFLSCSRDAQSPLDSVASPPSSPTPDNRVLEVLNQINPDSLKYFVRELSGDVVTLIEGVPDTITARSWNSEGHVAAAKYLAQKLAAYGLTVQLQSFSSTGTNITATQLGTDFPDIKYIVCAHYDDVPYNKPLAPGADDNASGSATVLEAARVLSKHAMRYTLVYALWDEEERGLYGSMYYAQQARTNGDSIMGVLNLDMLGWDGNADGKIELHTKTLSRSSQLADTLLFVNQLYSIGLNPTIFNPGTTASDHYSFWRSGFSATLFCEGYWGGDFNSHYHQNSDSLAYFNSKFFNNCARLAIATVAILASVKAP